MTTPLDALRFDDSHEGYHHFRNPETRECYGSFEIFHYHDPQPSAFNPEPVTNDMSTGWYWWACFSGCLADSEPVGPFPTSLAAYNDALGDFFYEPSEADIHPRT